VAKPVPLSLVPADRPAFVPTPAEAASVLEVAADRAKRGLRGAMATVVSRSGSAPATPGQKLYVAADGTCIGTVGGGAIEREVLAELERFVALGGEPPRHHIASFRLGAELGMCCGGSVEILIEPIEGSTPCLIVGGGHVASALAPMLAKVGFSVTVVDARDAWGQEGRLPGVRCVVGDYDDVGDEMSAAGVVLVMTHDHALDQKVIEWALKRGFAFVGGIGSRAKAQRTRDRLEAKGVSEEDRMRVKMPLGVSIGARLPHEIAVAVAAEMVTWRRRK
jgi:xanthine dehydrogenase accessory factor